MPFLILNGILSLISIFGGMYLWNRLDQKEQTIITLQNAYDSQKGRFEAEKRKLKDVTNKMFVSHNIIFKKHGIRVATYIDGNAVEIKPPTFSQKIYDLRRNAQINICHFLWKTNHDWLTYYFWPETGLPFPFVNRWP